MTQLLVDLPTKFGHVLLGEAEWLRQGQVLAVLGVNKAGHENHPLNIQCQDLCYTFLMRYVSFDLSENRPISQTERASVL